MVVDLGGKSAINAKGNARAETDEVIFVPVFEAKPGRTFGVGDFSDGAFAIGIENGAFAPPGEGVTAIFVIKAGQPWRVEIIVHLIAADVVVRENAAAKLETVVDVAFTVKTGLELQL